MIYFHFLFVRSLSPRNVVFVLWPHPSNSQAFSCAYHKDSCSCRNWLRYFIHSLDPAFICLHYSCFFLFLEHLLCHIIVIIIKPILLNNSVVNVLDNQQFQLCLFLFTFLLKETPSAARPQQEILCTFRIKHFDR